MTELEKEEKKLREIVNELHEVMKQDREAVESGTPEEEMGELHRKYEELWEARANQRRIVYKLRKEASKND